MPVFKGVNHECGSFFQSWEGRMGENNLGPHTARLISTMKKLNKELQKAIEITKQSENKNNIAEGHDTKVKIDDKESVVENVDSSQTDGGIWITKEEIENILQQNQKDSFIFHQEKDVAQETKNETIMDLWGARDYIRKYFGGQTKIDSAHKIRTIILFNKLYVFILKPWPKVLASYWSNGRGSYFGKFQWGFRTDVVLSPKQLDADLNYFARKSTV